MSGSGKSIKSVANTSDAGIDGLLSGLAWAGGSITYSFPTTIGQYGLGYYDGAPYNNFQTATANQKTAAYAALDANRGNAAAAGFTVEGFTNLNVTYTTGNDATIRIANSDAPGTAYAFYPGTYEEAGDVWLGSAYDSNYLSLKTPVAGNYAWVTMIHEIGHALGLEHAHEENIMPSEYDRLEYTVMSYRAYQNAPLTGYTFEQWGAPQTFMMYDIAALQEMYGADFTTNSGNTVYSWDPSTGHTLVNGQVAIDPGGNRVFATIWDGGGIDTYDLSSYSTNLQINLNPGEFSVFSAVQLAYLGNNNYAQGNIYNALQYNGDVRSLIENASGGTGNDEIIGNIASNELQGGEGDDTLEGRVGDDMLNGGIGDDILIGGSDYDTAVVEGNWTDFRFDLPSQGGDFTMTDLAASPAIDDGTDTLTSIEQINFAGGVIALVIASESTLSFDFMDSSNNLLSRKVLDANGSESWKSITYNYDASGTLTDRIVDYDNGLLYETSYSNGARSQLVIHDIPNNVNWGTLTYDYDASGALTSKTINYDSGQVHETTYTNGARSQLVTRDIPNDLTWETITYNYDASGTLIGKIVDYDNGQVYETSYTNGARSQLVIRDIPNDLTWETITYIYDASGMLTDKIVDYDSGRVYETSYTNGARSQQLIRDIADDVNWETVTTNYDASGALTSKAIAYDNGRIIETSYTNGARTQQVARDISDNYSWETNTSNYDESGVRTDKVVVYDDGRVYQTNYTDGVRSSQLDTDVDDVYIWTTRETQYDALGDPISRTTTFDDGSVVVDDFAIT